MKQEQKAAFELFDNMESALTPLDEVITLLSLLYDDFNLGHNTLTDNEQFDLLMNYQRLGDMLNLARRTIENVQEDFYRLNPAKTAAPDPEQTPAAS